MQTVRDLNVFKKAHLLTLRIYEVTKFFPHEELFGLTSQMRRVACSINSNLMEGGSKHSDKEYSRFILIARGSASELNYQIELVTDLNMINKQDSEYLKSEINQIGKMLSALHKSVTKNTTNA